jgi:phospholipid N-methyltransferase
MKQAMATDEMASGFPSVSISPNISARKLEKRKRHIPPKGRLILNGLQGVMSQKIEFFNKWESQKAL